MKEEAALLLNNKVEVPRPTTALHFLFKTMLHLNLESKRPQMLIMAPLVISGWGFFFSVFVLVSLFACMWSESLPEACCDNKRFNSGLA